MLQGFIVLQTGVAGNKVLVDIRAIGVGRITSEERYPRND